MEREIFRELKSHLRALGRRLRSGRFDYTEAAIYEVYAWAVINDRPTCWACCPRNWPPRLRRGELPSQSQVSRRMASPEMLVFRARLRQRVLRRGKSPGLALIIDGKPLPIPAHSSDIDARYGRSCGGNAKGYKLHAIIDTNAVVWAYHVAPMNVDERAVARFLLRPGLGEGYLLADKNYDSNTLFKAAADCGRQMVVPRRYGPERGLGRHKHETSRLRSRDMLETSMNLFGPALMNLRRKIEQTFSQLTTFGGGLNALPAWVRTLPRVQAWVDTKILIREFRSAIQRRRSEAVDA